MSSQLHRPVPVSASAPRASARAARVFFTLLIAPIVASGCVIVPARQTTSSAELSSGASSPSPPRSFPGTRSKLADADAAAGVPVQAESLYREALDLVKAEARSQRDEEFIDLRARAQAGYGNALMAQGRAYDALGAMATVGFLSGESSWRDHHARLAQAFPAAFRGGWVKPVYPLVLDDFTVLETMSMFERELPKDGVVVQRVHVTNVSPAGAETVISVVGRAHAISSEECRRVGTLTIERREYLLQRCAPGKPMAFTGATLKLRVPSSEGARVKLDAGEIDWIAFDSRALHRSGNTWDAGKGHVILIQ